MVHFSAFSVELAEGNCVIAARVKAASEWRNRQTRQLEGLVPLGACGFKSRLRHHCDVSDFLGQTNPQRLIVLPRLIILGRVEGEVANQLAVFGDDANVEIGHQNDDSLFSIAPSETDVVKCASVAARHTAGVVDAIVTDPGLREETLTGERGRCFVEFTPSPHRRTSSCLMRSLLVVVENEAVDLTLQLLDARSCGLFAQPLLQSLVVALDFSLGLGMVGLAVFEGDAEDRQANRTLHLIARLRLDPRTQFYMERRRAEGLFKMDVIRCLKRFIAREAFNALRQDLLQN